MQPSVGYDDVARAAGRLAGVARRTPVLTSAAIDRLAGARVYFKCENFQRTGAFKFRGAFNAVAQLAGRGRARGVATFSSGNHGQALALAARLHGLPAVVVMPRDAPQAKIAATRDYGAEVLLYDRDAEDRATLAHRAAQERNYVLVPPFDHPHIVAGQGTAARELLEDVDGLDDLYVPLGGGGLLAGSALAAQRLAPACRVIGVEPHNGNDGQQSLRAGRIVTIPVPATIADGARTTHLGECTFAVIRERVADIVTVADRDLIEAMRLLLERLKIVVEPTGALAAAAVLGRNPELAGKRVGVLLSGGNVDASALSRLLAVDM